MRACVCARAYRTHVGHRQVWEPRRGMDSASPSPNDSASRCLVVPVRSPARDLSGRSRGEPADISLSSITGLKDDSS